MSHSKDIVNILQTTQHLQSGIRDNMELSAQAFFLIFIVMPLGLNHVLVTLKRLHTNDRCVAVHVDDVEM